MSIPRAEEDEDMAAGSHGFRAAQRAVELVQRYLEATLPELAALTEERTVTAVGQWLVIRIDAAKAD